MPDLHGVIPETNLVFLSPHYDDVPLTWGGYLGALPQGKKVRIIHIFSRSIYQARDQQGNRDFSQKRLQYATGIRLIEDLNCLDELLGHGNYAYELRAERECVIRAKPWKEGEEFEFPQGNQQSFDAEEREIFGRLKRDCEDWLRQPDTAVLVPLCIKEHVDHVMVRDAVIEAAKKLGPDCKAKVYFGEDQPYAGLASGEDWATAQALIAALKLEALDYSIDIAKKVERVMKFYPSQVEESYRKGLLQRSQQLLKTDGSGGGMERIYRWSHA